jgi:hypothetical protein
MATPNTCDDCCISECHIFSSALGSTTGFTETGSWSAGMVEGIETNSSGSRLITVASHPKGSIASAGQAVEVWVKLSATFDKARLLFDVTDEDNCQALEVGIDSTGGYASLVHRFVDENSDQQDSQVTVDFRRMRFVRTGVWIKLRVFFKRLYADARFEVSDEAGRAVAWRSNNASIVVDDVAIRGAKSGVSAPSVNGSMIAFKGFAFTRHFMESDSFSDACLIPSCVIHADPGTGSLTASEIEWDDPDDAFSIGTNGRLTSQNGSRDGQIISKFPDFLVLNTPGVPDELRGPRHNYRITTSWNALTTVADMEAGVIFDWKDDENYHLLKIIHAPSQDFTKMRPMLVKVTGGTEATVYDWGLIAAATSFAEVEICVDAPMITVRGIGSEITTASTMHAWAEGGRFGFHSIDYPYVVNHYNYSLAAREDDEKDRPCETCLIEGVCTSSLLEIGATIEGFEPGDDLGCEQEKCPDYNGLWVLPQSGDYPCAYSMNTEPSLMPCPDIVPDPNTGGNQFRFIALIHSGGEARVVFEVLSWVRDFPVVAASGYVIVPFTAPLALEDLLPIEIPLTFYFSTVCEGALAKVTIDAV